MTEIFDSMDRAALEAEKELYKLPKESVLVIADWWSKYYLSAGHKRLGRLLVKYQSRRELAEMAGGLK